MVVMIFAKVTLASMILTNSTALKPTSTTSNVNGWSVVSAVFQHFFNVLIQIVDENNIIVSNISVDDMAA